MWDSWMPEHLVKQDELSRDMGVLLWPVTAAFILRARTCHKRGFSRKEMLSLYLRSTCFFPSRSNCQLKRWDVSGSSNQKKSKKNQNLKTFTSPAGRAMMVSKTWTSMELEDRVFSSTIAAFSLSILTSLVAVSLFTRNVLLAFYVCCTILLVVCVLSGCLLILSRMNSVSWVGWGFC